MQTDTTASDSRHEYAATFAAGLLNPGACVPDDAGTAYGNGVQARYNVYRNNVTVSLIDALASIYPAVQRITGVDFFRAMARFHIRKTPPVSPLLFEYGRDFPSFIEQYEYAQSIPWLADVARIERAWLDAYHAADMPAMPAEVFAGVAESALGAMRFVVHPATRIVRSAFPAVTIFAMNRDGGTAEPIHSNDAEDALITRPGQEVIVSRLPAGGAVFLSSLAAGECLADAVAMAFDAAASFDLQANLAGMIPAGAFTATQSGD